MTWEEIEALDDIDLLEAMRLARVVPVADAPPGLIYTRSTDAVGWALHHWTDTEFRPWNPLEDWRDTMALAWRYTLSVLHYQGQWSISNRLKPRDPHGVATTEADARRAICRLALWAAQQDNPFT